MANQLFGSYKQSLLEGTVAFDWGDMATPVIEVTAVESVVSQPNLDSFVNLDELDTAYTLSGTPVSGDISAPVAGRNVTSVGQAEANAVTFASLPVGPTYFSFVFYHRVSGSDNTLNTLIAYIDTGVGLSPSGLTPGGGVTTITPSTGTWFFSL